MPTIHSGEALKGTKGVNMYLDQRYYEPKGAFGRELFSDVFFWSAMFLLLGETETNIGKTYVIKVFGGLYPKF